MIKYGRTRNKMWKQMDKLRKERHQKVRGAKESKTTIKRKLIRKGNSRENKEKA